jgi:dihydropteroate synthase
MDIGGESTEEGRKEGMKGEERRRSDAAWTLDAGG